MAPKSWQSKPGVRRYRDKRPVASRTRFRASAAHALDGPAVLYGWHTVKAALENPARRIRRLLATENAARRLAEDGVPLPVKPELVRPDVIDARLGPDAVHQGLLAEADPLSAPRVTELEPDGIVLVLDQITDPHNVGAILRSAAAFAVGAIVTTARYPEWRYSENPLAPRTRTVVGQNLARCLEELRQRDFLLVGLDSGGEADLADVALRAPLALVLGAEGKGLRQLTKATCDRLARIDVPGEIKSLNVSNAAALALYVASRRLRDEFTAAIAMAILGQRYPGETC
jgi:23S rRNA (guanosine2251-2'-O)-methyltransferase